jgi:AAA domain/Bifunctional DNA primase/polymerase, N-terminal/Primase C terminal 2 (PriCT-2)
LYTNDPVASSGGANFFDFAQNLALALVKVHKGAKNPVGDGWQNLYSRNRSDWEQWQAEGFNIGVHAGASRVVIFDLDQKHGGIEAVRARFDTWCHARNMAPLPHHVTTPSGGQHIFMKVPEGVDAMALAPDLRGTIGKGVDVLTADRQSVAPGSFFNGAEGKPTGFYTFNEAPLYPAPQSVIEFCTCAPAPEAAPIVKAGKYDKRDVAGLIDWLNERGEFEEYQDWVNLGMALRAAFGDDGLDLWALSHDETVTPDVIATKWKSFATEVKPGAVTLATFTKRGKSLGWTGTLHEAGMLKGCAEYAAAAAEALTAPPIENKPTPPRYFFETVSDLRSMPPQAWLVDQWIPDRSVGIIYGRFASGKSFIAFDLLLHQAYGMKDWHGVKLPGVPCYGLLIAREGGTGFQRRIDAFKKHHNFTEDTDRIVFMRSPVNFGDPAQFADLKTAIETCGRQFKAVVVDTVGRALPGEDMFDPKSITRFMEHLQQIGEISQGVSIGIHHENKAGDVMGSIYFDNNSDFMFHVEREGEGALTRGKITCTKQKDGEDQWARDVSYKFVGTEPNGEGSLVVDSITGSGAAPQVTVKLSPKEGLALQALADVLKAKGQLGGDIGGRSVTLDEWLDGCFSNGSISRGAARPNRDLHDRQVGLLAKGRILVLDDRVRLIGEGVKGEPGNVIPMPPPPGNAMAMPPGTMTMAVPKRPT